MGSGSSTQNAEIERLREENQRLQRETEFQRKKMNKLMEEAKNPPPEPEPKMQFDREYDAYARESKARPEITESYAEMPPITVYTHNGKNSIAPDGNFGKNADFSTPAERYTKGPYKND